MTTGNALNTQFPFIVGGSGLYTTVQAAINAAAATTPTASTPLVVLINPGSYTENLSLKSFVNLASFGGDAENAVIIIGNAVYNPANDSEVFSASGITFMTPGGGGSAFAITGAKICNVDMNNCVFSGTTGTALECLNNNAVLRKTSCHLNASAGQKIINATGGDIKGIGCFAAATDTASTISGNTDFSVLSSYDTNAFVVSGTATFGCENSVVLAPGTLTFLNLGAGCTAFLLFDAIVCNAASGFYITGTGSVILQGMVPAVGTATSVDPGITIASSQANFGSVKLLSQSTALNANSNLINNVSNPISPQDAATKFYVDQTALNSTAVYAASAATLGTVTQSGSGPGATLTNAGAQATFALDGVNPPVGSDVLIKNTATGMTSANEGIYTVTSVGSGSTNWSIVRSTTYDTSVEINNTGLIVVQNGSSLAGTAWYNTTTIVTVDSTAFNYVRFGTSGTVTSISAGQGITLTPDPITSTGSVAITNLAVINVKVQVITSTNTYTPSAGLISATVSICGSGGGSGGTTGTSGQQAVSAGGGGGGTAVKTYTAALIGASAAVVIGAAGSAGSTGNNPGGAGGDSTFTPAGAGVVLTGHGGGGGAGGASTATTGLASPGGTGGTAVNGDLNIQGSQGSFGLIVAGVSGIMLPGEGGGSYLSNQSVQNLSGGVPNYGAGAYGQFNNGGTNDAGNAGTTGVCYIIEYCSQ